VGARIVRSGRAGEAAFHAVLLAGGSGTRFWPLSRARRPKQFLRLTGGASLLSATWRRVRALAPASRAWAVAPKALASAVRRELPELLAGRLVVEPAPKDTAPAIVLACAVVARESSPEDVVGLFPADHVIRDAPGFRRAIRVAVQEAARGSLVCLGVPPDRPATGFGYIKCQRIPRGVEAAVVERFVEKPSEAKARRYLSSGRYLWNAGIFVWQAGRFLEEVGRVAPRVLGAVTEYLDGKRAAWDRAPRISVDYAVLERASGVRVVPLRAGWDDVGSWEAVQRLGRKGGAAERRVLPLDSPGSVVFGDGTGRFVALVGLPGVVVVDTSDALLVMARDRSEDVKRVVSEIRALGRDDIL